MTIILFKHGNEEVTEVTELIANVESYNNYD